MKLQKIAKMPNRIVRVGHKILALPICYDLFQTAVGSVKFRSSFVSDNVSKFKMKNVLDLGCGTASTAKLFPKHVNYIGVDTSSKYLEKASSRVADRKSKLILADIAEYGWTSSAGKLNETLGLALGIYHHLNDQKLLDTIDHLSSVLEAGSKIVSLDPVIDIKSTNLAKWFAKNDRGPYIREPIVYEEIFNKNGFSVAFEITRNSFRIPYDLLLITATKEK
jgi:SAM-dependent methyltransferase